MWKMQIKRTMTFLAIAGLSLQLVQCGGGKGGPGQSQAVQSLSRGVRIGLQLTQPAEEGYLRFLSPESRAEAEKEGFVFRPTEIVFPTVPAIGYYLKVGDKYIPSGPNGEFYLPRDMVVPASVPLFKQLTDTEPIGSVNIGGALRPASDPLRLVVITLRGRKLGSAREMDGTDQFRQSSRAAKKESCCGPTRAINDGCQRIDCDTTTNDPTTGCCLDYDVAKGRIVNEDQGDEGDRQARSRIDGFCVSKRVAEFIGTECYKWTFGSGSSYSAACINERAILQVTGPSCWANHKYRFCQNMRMNEFDVSVTGSVQVRVGSSVPISVTNNTPANETMVTVTGDAAGDLELTPGVSKSGASFIVRHYEDSELQHYKVRQLVYKAPASLPDGQTEATNTLTFTANGMTKTLTIRVVQKCPDSRQGGPCY
jgi:hypothetical protein